MSGDHAAHQQNNSEDTRPRNGDLSGVALEHPQSHDHGDGDGHADSEDAPGAIRERIHDHDAEPGERDQKNEEHRDHRHQSGKRTDLGAGNIRQRTAAMTYRSYQHGEVLHTTRKHAPTRIQRKPGANPNCAASVGPTSGPAPAMAAK